MADLVTALARREVENALAMQRSMFDREMRQRRVEELMLERRSLRMSVSKREDILRLDKGRLKEVERLLSELRTPGDLKKG